MKIDARALPGSPRSTAESLVKHGVNEGNGYEFYGGSRGTAMPTCTHGSNPNKTEGREDVELAAGTQGGP